MGADQRKTERQLLAQFLKLVEDGILVRNTANDGDVVKYLRNSTSLVITLKEAQEALKAESVERPRTTPMDRFDFDVDLKVCKEVLLDAQKSDHGACAGVFLHNWAPSMINEIERRRGASSEARSSK